MRKQTKRWITKDGRKIRICDMDDDHLMNTIKMLEKWAQDTADGAMFPCFNGEMAQMCAENSYYHLQDDPIGCLLEGGIYDNLIDDAIRRNLY